MPKEEKKPKQDKPASKKEKTFTKAEVTEMITEALENFQKTIKKEKTGFKGFLSKVWKRILWGFFGTLISIFLLILYCLLSS